MNEPWEMISEFNETIVCRHKVEGGHLYVVTIGAATSFTTTFVPDVDLQRYQSHLRDAYKQGYQAGQEDAKMGVCQSDMGWLAMPRHRREHRRARPDSTFNPHRLYSKTSVERQGSTQTVNVTVQVDEKDDCLTGCFGALLRGCKKGT